MWGVTGGGRGIPGIGSWLRQCVGVRASKPSGQRPQHRPQGPSAAAMSQRVWPDHMHTGVISILAVLPLPTNSCLSLQRCLATERSVKPSHACCFCCIPMGGPSNKTPWFHSQQVATVTRLIACSDLRIVLPVHPQGANTQWQGRFAREIQCCFCTV
jgi:hypothetical protein